MCPAREMEQSAIAPRIHTAQRTRAILSSTYRHVTSNQHLGKYIAKKFPRGCFIGKVVALNGPYYRVVYSDRDEEDFTERELPMLMAAYTSLGSRSCAEQQPLADEAAVTWLKAADSLDLLAEAAEQLEASGLVG